MKNLYYYVLFDPDKDHVCKVGITTNPTNRLKSYKTAAPRAFYYGLYNLPDRRHERQILDLMKERFTVRSEVVYCNPHIVKNIVEGYFMDNDIIC